MKKRLLSLALVLALILSFGCTVLAASVNDYVDVPQNAWYRGAVDYVLQRGYMVGATANQFNPEGAVTRAQIAQIFYAMNGKPSAGTKPRFSDVSAGSWYAAAVNWAATFGVVSGYPDGSYHPMEFITRQQLATILYKYAQLKGYPPVNEVNMKGQFFRASFGKKPQVPNTARQAASLPGEMGSIPASGRSPGGGNGNPLQYSCLDNHMDRGA